jgi:hypothetical protein
MNNPCNTCDKKRNGCYCKEFSEWVLDDSLPEPILGKKKKRKFSLFNFCNNIKQEDIDDE